MGEPTTTTIKECIRSAKAPEKAKTQNFPKEGKARLSQATAEKQGIP